MGYQNHAVCDCCERVKGETNNWFLLSASEFTERDSFNLTSWSGDAAEGGMYLFLCGHECIVKMLNQFLGGK